MTNYVQLKTCLIVLGIKFTEDNEPGLVSVNKRFEGGKRIYDDVLVHYRLEIAEGCGYTGFLATFYFDMDGKFIDHGIWE